MNMFVVIENQNTKERHGYRIASALVVQCPCGGFIHIILGAWCVLCRAKVVQVEQVD
jgi:hypothetical protein